MTSLYEYHPGKRYETGIFALITHESRLIHFLAYLLHRRGHKCHAIRRF